MQVKNVPSGERMPHEQWITLDVGHYMECGPYCILTLQKWYVW
jgi:hypothetical protein